MHLLNIYAKLDVSDRAVPAFFWLTKLVGDRRRRVARSTQEALAAMSAISEETLSVSGVLLAKVFGNQGRDIGRYRRGEPPAGGPRVGGQSIGPGVFPPGWGGP